MQLVYNGLFFSVLLPPLNIIVFYVKIKKLIGREGFLPCDYIKKLFIFFYL